MILLICVINAAPNTLERNRIRDEFMNTVRFMLVNGVINTLLNTREKNVLKKLKKPTTIMIFHSTIIYSDIIVKYY